MTTKTRPSGVIVATFGLLDPFQDVDQKGFDIAADDESEPITSEMIFVCESVLEGNEHVAPPWIVWERANEKKNPGGLRAWWRVSEGYPALAESFRQELAGGTLFFPGTRLCGRVSNQICMPVLRCHEDRCDRRFCFYVQGSYFRARTRDLVCFIWAN